MPKIWARPWENVDDDAKSEGSGHELESRYPAPHPAMYIIPLMLATVLIIMFGWTNVAEYTTYTLAAIFFIVVPLLAASTLIWPIPPEEEWESVIAQKKEEELCQHTTDAQCVSTAGRSRASLKRTNNASGAKAEQS